MLLACALAFALKFLGYVVPTRLLEGDRTTRVTSALPVALLAALVAVQTFTSGDGALALDSRAAAVLVALVALALRAPFLVVVLLGAVVAAGLRMLGLP